MMIMFGRGASGVGSPEVTDSERRHADQIKYGTVKEVDYKKARARVVIGDETDPEGHLLTGWLQFGGGRARGDREWNPPEVGERVMVLSESGEVQNGMVLPLGLYTDEDPANGDRAGLWRKTFKDGSVIEYDRDSGGFKIDAKTSLELKIGDVSLKITSEGFAFTGGKITHDGHLIDKNHHHKDTQPGAGLSGVPV